MIFRAFDELTSAFPAVFWTQLNPTDAAKLLARQSERGALLEEHAVGGVDAIGGGDGIKVVLHWRRPFIRNPFAPIFEGDLRPNRDGSQLVGEFRRRKIVLLLCGLSYFILLPGIPFVLAATPLMSIWLGASVLWGVVAGAFSALALVCALFALAAVMRIGVYAAKRDANRIAAHIDNVFGHQAA